MLNQQIINANKPSQADDSLLQQSSRQGLKDDSPSQKNGSTLAYSDQSLAKKSNNVSVDLLKDFFQKKRQQKEAGFRSKAAKGAKKAFLSDAHVKNIIGEMQSKTDKCVDRLRL